MDRFCSKGSVLLDYNITTPQRLTTSCDNNDNDTDIDFTDVFGGPPRRSSMQDTATRYSFGSETRMTVTDSCEDDGTSLVSGQGRWSGLSERPVFGDRKGNVGDDFFDDIFNGAETLNSSPRMRIHRDPFSCSSPGSRGLSPVHALPPRVVDPLLGSSVPASFSLPAKLIKGTYSPTFGSSNRKSKDVSGSNGVSNYAFSPLSRSSSQVQEELRKEVHRKITLAQQLSLNCEESSDSTKHDEQKKGSSLKSEQNSLEAPLNGGQFHFSIYKWATKGIPLNISGKGGNKKNKIKPERSSSTNGRTMMETDFLRSFEIEPEKHDNSDPNFDVSGRDGVESCHILEGAILSKPENNNSGNDSVVVEDIPGNGNTSNTILPNSRDKIEGRCDPRMGLFGKLAQEISESIQESPKTEQQKPPRSHFYDEIDERNMNSLLKESKVKSTKKSSAVFDVVDEVKKQDGKRETLNRKDMDELNLQGSPARENLVKDKVRGKVKEFVRIFDQEASVKLKSNGDPKSQSSRWNDRGACRMESENPGTKGVTNENSHRSSVNMMCKEDVSATVDQSIKSSEKESTDARTENSKPQDHSSETKESFRSVAGSVPEDSGIIRDTDDSFHTNFMIQEIANDEEKPPKFSTNREEIKAIDAKILNWSKGKEGNIRSLLSTLQYVLWPESGWKPVPLVDIIEGNAVRRSYQKALLCLHPDKLQQKGASTTQKHIAEKVFDVLQEAWTHFNTLGAA